MKLSINLFKTIALVCALFGTTILMAQSTPKPIVGVLGIDIDGFTMEADQAGSITRTELSKLGNFEVMDRYDADFLLEKNNIEKENCFGKLCLVEIGKAIKTDKMLTGKIEVIGEQINITYRLIDVGTESIEKTQVMEFLNLRQQLQSMIQITLRTMFEMEIDQNLFEKLTKRDDYKSAVNTEKPRLNLNGPRMGMMVMTGQDAEIFKAAKAEGGYDLYPMMFQFGYQFEIQYINQGDFQALFEFIPMITGLDQGKFISSISILNGMRSSRTGLEFAFGPILYSTQKARGYEYEGQWYLQDAVPEGISAEELPALTSKLDSRGTFGIESRFVFGIGKTFRSGKLNIPVNAFFIPGKSGHRMGVSVGYNVSK